MTKRTLSFKGDYTCKVSGESYQYEAEYNAGTEVRWRARVYLDGDLKGNPSGKILENTLDGEALRQYIVAYVESIIEKGLGIAE